MSTMSLIDAPIIGYNVWKLHAGADCGRFPVKPKDGTGGKIPTENHCCRT